MHNWVCLLRGIGGKYSLPSAVLIEVLESLGASDVKTYIATGNAVFRSCSANPRLLAKKISDGINAARGFAPQVLLLSPAALHDAIENNPFPGAVDEPTRLHLFFLPEPPTAPDLEKLESLKQNGEQFVLREQVFYLNVPKGFSDSKLAPQVEKQLGTWATARNWRSSCRILELAKALRQT